MSPSTRARSEQNGGCLDWVLLRGIDPLMGGTRRPSKESEQEPVAQPEDQPEEPARSPARSSAS